MDKMTLKDFLMFEDSQADLSLGAHTALHNRLQTVIDETPNAKELLALELGMRDRQDLHAVFAETIKRVAEVVWREDKRVDEIKLEQKPR